MHRPNYSRPPPDLVDGEEEFKVEQILGKKKMGKGHKTHYHVKWKGYPTSNNSWEPEKNLNAAELIAEFKQSSRPKKTKGRRAYIRMTRTALVKTSPLISTTHPLLLIEMSSAPATSTIPSRTMTPELSIVPQLAIRTLPMPEDSKDSTSDVNYEASQDQTPIPACFITNDPTHPFFYPIHVPNPTYQETDNTWTGTRTIVAPFIRYSSDFTTVYRSAGVGHEEESLPVHLLKKVQDPHHLSYKDWVELQNGSQTEFAINMAIEDINDPCLKGEVNCYRKEIRAARALRDIESEAHTRLHKATQEREVMERVLKESMRRLEQAGVYEELLHRNWTTTPLPIPPLPIPPHTTPLLPRRNGQAEMPILAGEGSPTKCYRCHSLDHVVSRCPMPCHSKGCSKCSSRKHRTKQCSIRGGTNSPRLAPSKEQMTLNERIALLDKTDWAPALCKKL